MEDRQYKAIEQLYLEFSMPMFRYAQNVLGNKSLAEEAMQESFRIACDKPEDLMESPNPQGWMMNTLKHVIRNIRRRQKRDERLLAAFSESVSGDGAQQEALETLEALNRDEDYLLIRRFALDGQSVYTIAGELGITLPACRKRMQRARERLRKKLKSGSWEDISKPKDN